MATEGFSGAASGGQIEEKIDLSKEVEQKIPQAQTLVDQGQLKEALALLFALEKKCRTGNDTPSLVKVCVASLQHCKDVGDMEVLLTTLETLCTRRSQKTQAIKSLVELAMPWCLQEGFHPLEAVKEMDQVNRDKLVVALRDITDGKLFLEAERARLTRALAIIKVSASLLFFFAVGRSVRLCRC
jgi:26S proteasome regulatory subunit N5